MGPGSLQSCFRTWTERESFSEFDNGLNRNSEHIPRGLPRGASINHLIKSVDELIQFVRLLD